MGSLYGSYSSLQTSPFVFDRIYKVENFDTIPSANDDVYYNRYILVQLENSEGEGGIIYQKIKDSNGQDKYKKVVTIPSRIIKGNLSIEEETTNGSNNKIEYNNNNTFTIYLEGLHEIANVTSNDTNGKDEVILESAKELAVNGKYEDTLNISLAGTKAKVNNLISNGNTQINNWKKDINSWETKIFKDINNKNWEDPNYETEPSIPNSNASWQEWLEYYFYWASNGNKIKDLIDAVQQASGTTGEKNDFSFGVEIVKPENADENINLGNQNSSDKTKVLNGDNLYLAIYKLQEQINTLITKTNPPEKITGSWKDYEIATTIDMTVTKEGE